jgi:hypothetical protein
MLQNIQSGLDTISLLGSYISSNDQYIFISSNGYNIYNGMIMVFVKNIENIDNKLTLEFHSEIHSPENFNSNFGIKTCATNKMLAVSAISYNVYDGIIYIYELFTDAWIYRYKIYVNTNNKMNGFGANIQINNNQLFISTFYNEIYYFTFDVNSDDIFSLKTTFKIFNSSEANLYVKMITDNKNNLFLTNLTNALTIINIETMSYSYFLQEGLFNCFYGSELFIYDKTLFISCSLYYPFYNIPKNIYSQIYIYDLIYEGDNIIQSIILREIINNEDNDSYFGTQLHVNDKHLIIPGRNAIYHYSYVNNKSEFKNKYIIPYSTVNYDYKVLLVNDYFIVGNYGFNELQGALFVGKTIDDFIPSYINTIQNSVRKSIFLNNIFSVIFLIIIGCVITLVITLFCYFFITLFIPKNDEKKKKKEDEEFSPYKVYSYAGYIETDDVPIVYPMNYNPQYYYTSNYNPQYYYTSNYNPQYYYNYYNPHMEKEKEKEKGKEKGVVTSPEKVVSYKGYMYDYAQQRYREKIKPILDDIKKEDVTSQEKILSCKGYMYDSAQQRYREKIKPILDEIKKND